MTQVGGDSVFLRSSGLDASDLNAWKKRGKI